MGVKFTWDESYTVGNRETDERRLFHQLQRAQDLANPLGQLRMPPGVLFNVRRLPPGGASR